MNEEDAQVKKKESQVNSETHQLNQSLDRLADVVNKLEEVLNSVLIEQPPVVTEDKKEQALVSLAERIRSNRRIVNRIADQVYNMLDRLEL